MARMSTRARREDPRTNVSWPVRMWVDEELLVGRALNITEQGLCVLTAPTDALKRGACYRIDMVVGAEQQVSVPPPLVGLRTVERLKLT